MFLYILLPSVICFLFVLPFLFVYPCILFLPFSQKQEVNKKEITSPLGGTGHLEGARIGIIAKPSAEFVAGLLGTWLSGGVAVPLALNYPEAELYHVMNDSVCPASSIFSHFCIFLYCWNIRSVRSRTRHNIFISHTNVIFFFFYFSLECICGFAIIWQKVLFLSSFLKIFLSSML